ncbi:MAG: hypothetical protein WCP46_00365 [Alphaproteobacteria bacterium]
MFKLTRLNDGLINFGDRVKWIEYKEDGNLIYDTPEIGRGCILYYSPFKYWQTTIIKSFSLENNDVTMFTTQNSNYKLEQYEDK